MTKLTSMLGAPFCVAIGIGTVLSATPSVQEANRIIKVNEGRPLAAAILKLENQLGQAISYEDPPYAHSDDYVDSTASVSGVPNSARRSFSPRGGRFEFSYRWLPEGREHEQTRSVLSAMLMSYSRNYSSPAIFELRETPSAFHVVPVVARDRNGLLIAHEALLDTVVDLSSQDMTALAAIDSVVSAISAKTKRPLFVGNVPLNVLYRSRTNIGSVGQPARTVLLGVLEATGEKMSWRMLCTAGAETMPCYLNIRVVPRPGDRTK
jgi:hypothetical protein